jgi:NAD dependent epimerase/dehydratase family enzyme
VFLDEIENLIITKPSIQLMKALGKVLYRPVWPIPAPAFVLRLILGESAQLALMSTSFSKKKLLDSWFAFHYTDLEQALRVEL